MVEQNENNKRCAGWFQYPAPSAHEMSLRASPTPIVWSFHVEKARCKQICQPKDWTANCWPDELSIPEWEFCSIEKYKKSYHVHQDKENDGVDFFVRRFALFASKINKRRQTLGLIQVKQLGYEFDALIHYFRVQNKFCLLLEQEGEESAKLVLDVTKKDVLDEIAKFVSGAADSRSMQQILDMIDLYYFHKFPWYAELHLPVSVQLSEQMLKDIQKATFVKTETTMWHLCFYIHQLSQGQSLLGTGMHNFGMAINPKDSYRLQPHQDFACTWMSFERLNPQQVLGSAFLPRRVPQFSTHKETGAREFAGFQISQYAMLLGVCDKDKVNNKSFYKALPVDRLQCFRFDKIKIAMDLSSKSSLNTFVNNLNSLDNKFAEVAHKPSISKNFVKYHEKRRLNELLEHVYQLSVTFKQNMFGESYDLSFFGQHKLYSKSAETGFWEYDFQKASRTALDSIVNTSMPKWYVAGARAQLQTQTECLVLRRNLMQWDQDIGASAQKRETIYKVEKASSKQALSQVLAMLPTLDITLNDEQRQIMNDFSNMFILGRSGTGKTTTTVLRFFCQETLFRALRKKQRIMNQLWLNDESAEYKKVAKQMPKLTYADMQEDTSVRMVFVTASPVLTNEVKQYYANLKQQLALHLLKFEKVESNDQSAQSDDDARTEDQQNEDQRQKLMTYLELKEAEIMHAVTLEQQRSLPESFKKLQPQQFPLFLTVQKLVYMLDASLNRSFFSRTSHGKIIGMEQSLGWHSGEDQGVFMINQDFKQSEEVKKELREFELKILAGDLSAQEASEHIQVSDFDLVTGEQNLDGHQDREQDAIPAKEGVLDYNFRTKDTVVKNQSSKKKVKKMQAMQREIDDFGLCQEITFEVFEDRFLGRFYRFMSKKLTRKLSPTFVWTEFMSVIKGSISQRQNFQRYLSIDEYCNQGSVILSRKEKQTLYYLFLKYEDWKLHVHAFDFLDVVNHIMHELMIYPIYSSVHKIDYLVIDEVQDLYPKTVKLLLEHTQYKVVFAGDTAQTIAKGVSIRISDLNKILSQRMDVKSQQINLTVNYRSQNSILQLANNVVKLLETIFPKSLDKMTEEVSQRDGPKPFVLAPMPDNLLCHFFFGKSQDEANVENAQEENTDDEDFELIDDDDDDGQQKSSADTAKDKHKISKAPHFGASQVVIVREQNVKQQLPDFMKGMLCLTVYEAKGLEFDDVILFNFFAMGEIKSQQWKLLQHISETETTRDHIPDWILDLDEAECNAQVEESVEKALADHRAEKVARKEQPSENKYYVDPEKQKINDEKFEQELIHSVTERSKLTYRKNKEEQAKKKYLEDGSNAKFIKEWIYCLQHEGTFEIDESELSRKFSQLCTELKFLYVAITRPRNKLYIVDESVDARKAIEDIWSRIGAVEFITKDQVKQSYEDEQAQKEKDFATIITTGDKSSTAQGGLGSGSLTIENADEESWKFQGLRFLKQKNYTQAIKCFRYARSRQLVLRCKAFIIARKAQEFQAKIDMDAFEFKRKMPYLRKSKKKETIAELQHNKLEACKLFYRAGLAFERAKMNKQAASCFFTARSYSKAAEIFQKLELYAQAGECLVYIGKDKLNEAAKLFEKGGLVLRAIECYERNEEWEYLLHCLNRNQDQLGESERQSLVNKYVPIALNNIYCQHGIVSSSEQEVGAVPIGDAGNVGQKVQSQIQSKYKAKDTIIEEAEALDEYGEELVFHSGDSDEEDREDGEPDDPDQKALKDAEESKNNNESDDEADDGVFSKEFGLESIIRDQYKTKVDKVVDNQDEEKKQEKDENDSFEVIASDEDEEQKSQEDLNQDQNQIDATRGIRQMGPISDSFDHLSQYDPDDQLIKSERSMSIIESYMYKSDNIKSGALSETSEFSIISSPNLKSLVTSAFQSSQNKQQNQISFIDQEGDDTYMQDVIAQKIIYYLSLWSEDMRTQLTKLKKQGILHEVDQNEKSEHIDETDFIIQMDEVDQDFVNLILDTLEIYEFYHMSLMMCKRYGLTGRQGRYLVLMCSKYSNLNVFRSNFMDRLDNQKFQQAQSLCSLLAHEAIHNVLTLLDSKFLTMKPFGEILTDQNSLGLQTYKNILNLGFWKKLVYIIDKKTALQLCLKFLDFKNFWILYKAFLTQEEKMQNRHLIDEWTVKAQFKDLMLQKRKLFSETISITTYTPIIKKFVEDVDQIAKASQLNQKTMASFLSIYRYIGEYIQLQRSDIFAQERQAGLAQETQNMQDIFDEQLSVFRRGGEHSTYTQKFAAATIIFDLCFSHANMSNQRTGGKFFNNILVRLSIASQIVGLLQESLDTIHKGKDAILGDPILEALYGVFQVSQLDDEDQSMIYSGEKTNLFENYSASYMLLSVHSPLMAGVKQIQSYHRDQDIHSFAQSQHQRYKDRYFHELNRRQKMKSTIQEHNFDQSIQQWKAPDSEQNFAFIADMDAQFVFVPKDWIKSLLKKQVSKVIGKILFSTKCRQHTLPQPFFKQSKHLLKLLGQESTKNDFLTQIIDTHHNKKVFVDIGKYMKNPPQLHLRYNKLRCEYSTESLCTILSKFKLRQTGIHDSETSSVFWPSLLVGSAQATGFDQSLRDQYNNSIKLGLQLFKQTLGSQLQCLNTKQPSQNDKEFMFRMFQVLEHYLQADRYIAFLELYRNVAKKVKAIKNATNANAAVAEGKLAIIKSVMHAVDVHVLIKNGQGMLASYQMLSLSQKLPQAVDSYTPAFSNKIHCLEFSAFTSFLIKFGKCCIPDYGLFYLKKDFNFGLYQDDHGGEQLEKEDGHHSTAVSTLKKMVPNYMSSIRGGFGRKEQGFIDCDEGENFYEQPQQIEGKSKDVQFVKKTGDYEDDQMRMCIEVVIQPDCLVEKPNQAACQHLYERVLTKIVETIEQVTKDSVAFCYKKELIRLYNLLMVVVVNDTSKSKRVCELLGQGFNKLVNSDFEMYFVDIGVPPEWSDSSTGARLSNSDFSDTVEEFKQADKELRWQWFAEVVNSPNNYEPTCSADEVFTKATGFFAAQVDATQAQSEDNQKLISQRETASIHYENSQLALRMAAAWTITRILKKAMSAIKNRRLLKKQKNQERLQIVAPISSDINKGQSKISGALLARARAFNLFQLTMVPQINLRGFIEKLTRLQNKSNYLQELMIAKAFQNSIEISQAVNFMTQLSQTFQSYQAKAQVFAREQISILTEFDLCNDTEDDMHELQSELDQELQSLFSRVDSWLSHVFQGDSSGLALKSILETQTKTQSRLKLKWQQNYNKPSTQRQTLKKKLHQIQIMKNHTNQ